MKLIKFLINPRKYITNNSRIIADGIINNQKLIPITETLENDIFIVGYPKSGNTWMQNLISGILLESSSKRITPNLVNNLVPDMEALNYYHRYFPTMYFKTHQLPDERFKRVIHLVRDGRDAMVSYYKMEINRHKNFPFTLKDIIVEDKGGFHYKWHTHTMKWIENPYNSEIITIRYEDLLLNPVETMNKIVNFMKVDIDKGTLENIYNANSLSALKEKVSEYGWNFNVKYENKDLTSFFRKGKIASYKTEMDKVSQEFFVKESEEELKYFGYL